MDSAIAGIFLKSSIDRLRKSSADIEKCLERLSDEQVWTRGAAHENAIGNLMLHLCGNARQWIISGVGGAADIRQRDSEFAAQGGLSKQQLLGVMHQTVSEAIGVLETVEPERLAEMIVPQGHTVPVLEAIYQVVAHFQQHTGQIIFITKVLSGEDLGLFRPKTA